MACRTVLASLLCLAFAVPAVAGEPIVIGERLTLESKVLGEERTILVSTPNGYDQGDLRYPVLYLTDGAENLLHTRGTVDFLAANGLMPDLVIVGIANTDRPRDLNPTRADYVQPDGTRIPFPTSGGADRFLELIETELIPWVESHYRTAPYRILCGHSAGGGFVVTALLKRPHLFNAYLAASPGLAWDNQVLVRWAAPFFAERRVLNKALFATIGNEDAAARAAFDGLVEVLSRSKATGFRSMTMTLPEEDHDSVVLRSYYSGLRWLFDGWKLPSDPATGTFNGSLEDVQRHYREVTARVGLQVRPPERRVNQLGYQALARGNLTRALDFFRFNVATYPGSANVHDSLADALEAAGQLDEALEKRTAAVELGAKNDDPNTPVYQANLDRLKTRLRSSEQRP